MGFGKIFGFLGNAAKKIGSFATGAFSKIGSFKTGYDAVNGLTGGLIGNSLESLPVVGGLLKGASGVMNNVYGGNRGIQHGMQNSIDRFHNHAQFAPRGSHLPGLVNI